MATKVEDWSTSDAFTMGNGAPGKEAPSIGGKCIWGKLVTLTWGRKGFQVTTSTHLLPPRHGHLPAFDPVVPYNHDMQIRYNNVIVWFFTAVEQNKSSIHRK